MISHQNSLWPSNIRTILKFFTGLEKQPDFSYLIICSNTNNLTALIQKVESAGVKVSKLKFSDSGVGIWVVKFFCRLPSPELDCRISKSMDSQFAVLWNEISLWGIIFVQHCLCLQCWWYKQLLSKSIPYAGVTNSCFLHQALHWWYIPTFDVQPYASGTNSCFLNNLFTLEVQTVAFLNHSYAGGANSCFVNQLPTMEALTVAW